MRRTAVGPYQIVKRQGRFEVHDGSAVLSKHGNYLDAEEAALRAWLARSKRAMTVRLNRNANRGSLHFLPNQLNMPPTRPPVSSAFFCFASKLS
jgi:hypothetical protein